MLVHTNVQECLFPQGFTKAMLADKKVQVGSAYHVAEVL